MNDKCLSKYIISVRRTTNKMKSKHRALYRYYCIHVWATVSIRFDTVKTCTALRGYRTWDQNTNTTKYRNLYFRLLSGSVVEWRVLSSRTYSRTFMFRCVYKPCALPCAMEPLLILQWWSYLLFCVCDVVMHLFGFGAEFSITIITKLNSPATAENAHNDRNARPCPSALRRLPYGCFWCCCRAAAVAMAMATRIEMMPMAIESGESPQVRHDVCFGVSSPQLLQCIHSSKRRSFVNLFGELDLL